MPATVVLRRSDPRMLQSSHLWFDGLVEPVTGMTSLFAVGFLLHHSKTCHACQPFACVQHRTCS